MPREWLKLGVLLAVLSVGCPGDLDDPPGTTPGRDAAVDTTPKSDKNWPPPPEGSTADSMQWPDHSSYSPMRFGCQRDADCFGLKCCTTPWGVRLCAHDCAY